MSSSEPISAESARILPPIADQSLQIAAKPLKRKYDKRKDNGKHLKVWNNAQKALKRKALGRTESISELQAIDSIKLPREMFKECVDSKSYALAWQIRSDIENRAFGRPYVAINPEAAVRPGGEEVTQRISIAAKNLQIVQAPPEPKRKPRAIQAAAKPAGGLD